MRGRLVPCLLPALLLAAGCAHRTPPPPPDVALDQAGHAGRMAMELGRPRQAADQYRQAYADALARDDVQAIADCGYDLAVAELADGNAAAALRAALRTRDALVGRRATGFAELDLVQAAALHRLGRDADADRLAAQAQRTAGDPATIAKASYVRGLAADARGDQAAMVAALAGFGQPRQPSADWQADHDALSARLEFRRGRYGRAADFARQAADLRRAQLSYREMAEMLALAGTALQRAGSAREAAGLFLQAGDSAAARGDDVSARRWFGQATGPEVDPATRRIARDRLTALVTRVGSAD